jgi:hypothetical protein
MSGLYYGVAGSPIASSRRERVIQIIGVASFSAILAGQSVEHDFTLAGLPSTAVDPSDDCTIWYVGDHLKKGANSYSTRIGAFRIPGCTP